MSSLYKQAKSHIPETITMPRSWLTLYEDFVADNSGSVSQIESALRSLTYIIPGRFKESELASESLHSTLSLLTLYHTSLLSRVYSHLPPSLPRPQASLHNRYTKFWTSSSPTYTRLATLLQTLQYTELLWEMLARRRGGGGGGSRTRWRVVVFLETIKAFVRIALMRLTGERPLVNPVLPEREVDPRKVVEEGVAAKAQARNNGHFDELGLGAPPYSPPETAGETGTGRGGRDGESELACWTMPRTGLSLPSLPETSDVTEFLLKKVLTADDIKAPALLLHRLATSRAQVTELMWVLRPVVYAVLMARWQSSLEQNGGRGRGRGNSWGAWTPWLVGVGMEVVARQVAKRDLAERVGGGMRGLTGLEREELSSRGWGMGWWGLRGAFYENVTRPWIQSAAGKLKGKMLLDMVGTVVEDYDYLWDEYYFSTATM